MINAEESGFFNSPGSETPYQAEESYHDFRPMYISECGVCRVFTARRHGRTFVIKTLKEDFRGNATAIALLRKEYDIAISIDSPYTATAYDFINLPDLGESIVYEYAPGQTLRELMAVGEVLPATAVDSIISKLAEGLTHIHARGIAHLDLKPDNIIYDPATDRLKIIDFGFSDSEQYYLFRLAGGTNRYVPDGTDISPNQRDLYALGVILSEFLPIVPSVRCRPVRTMSDELTQGKISNASGISRRYYTLISRRKLFVVACAITAGVVISVATAVIISHRHASLESDATPELPIETDSITPITVTPLSTPSEEVAVEPAQNKVLEEKTKNPSEPQPNDEIIPGIPIPPADTIRNRYGVSLAEAKYAGIFSRNDFDKTVIETTDGIITGLARTFSNDELPYSVRRQAYAVYRSQERLTDSVERRIKELVPDGNQRRARGLASQRWTIYNIQSLPDTLARRRN